MIWCLHGFLGQATDWDFLRTACGRAGGPTCVSRDLFSGPALTVGLEDWAVAFAEEVLRSDNEAILLGYSLGGRLALHALVARPDVWRAAVIVSAHLGLEDAEAREQRRLADEQWARRFEREPWEGLLSDWNRQPVFGGRSQTVPRREEDFDRSALAAGLRCWSLGAQPPLTRRLRGYAGPVLWIAGEHDRRFVTQGREAMRQLQRGALRVAPGAGHRVPWEVPDWFVSQVLEFVRSPNVSQEKGRP